MKKTILLLFIVTVIPILTSCRDNATVFPDMERGFSLEIRADESAEAPDIVLFVERDGDGYKANFTVPEELSNVSVTYGKVLLL